MSTIEIPSTTAIASWFGSNRMLAEHVGAELAKCRWVGIPFAGGMSELPYIKAKMLVNDLHPHLINMVRAIQNDATCAEMEERLPWYSHMEEFLIEAQARCLSRDIVGEQDLFFVPKIVPNQDTPPDAQWAIDYFVCSWMGMGGFSGKEDEFKTAFSYRYTAGGGGSATRFRSAIRSLPAWHQIFSSRCEFSRVDAMEFLSKCRDEPDIGIYCDPPFPVDGDVYKFKFSLECHALLAARLSLFKNARIVCRFHAHPLIDRLYLRDKWTRIERVGRNQGNNDEKEWLLINGKSLVTGVTP